MDARSDDSELAIEWKGVFVVVIVVVVVIASASDPGIHLYR